MYYLCPNCGSFMQRVTMTRNPPITYYKCFGCGYKSKEIEQSFYTELPKELWSEEDSSNECSN